MIALRYYCELYLVSIAIQSAPRLFVFQAKW